MNKMKDNFPQEKLLTKTKRKAWNRLNIPMFDRTQEEEN